MSTSQSVEKTTPNVSELLTIEEVVSKMGITMLTVRSRIAQGYLHPIKGVKPDPFGRARKYPRLLFNPAEVESEIQRIQEIHESRRGNFGQGYSHSDPTNQKKKSRGQEMNENPSATAKIKIKASREFVDSVSTLMSDGKKCAEAVRLFRSGKGMLDIIEILQIDFETSKYFWQSYLECQPSWVLPPKDLARIRSVLDWREDPPTVEGFNRALNKCMTEAPERTSLISNKENDAVDAALANLEPSEEDE